MKNICYIFLLIFLICPGCYQVSEDGYTPSGPEPIYFSKNWRKGPVPAIDQINARRVAIFRSHNGNLVYYLYVGSDLFESSSTDNGRSWTEPKLIFSHSHSASPVFVDGKMIGVVAIVKVANGGQMYFQTRQGESWSEAVPIRDTYWGEFSSLNFTADTSGNIYCTWLDWREGSSNVYFSVSDDAGSTWSANIRVDNDVSGQEKREPGILSTPDGILYILWADNRNPATLFDIYYSLSVDGGKDWTGNIKVNDDTTRSWQTSPSAVIDNSGNLFAVWSDYRDRGASGDVLSNIYFARFEMNKNVWSNNIRITNAQFGHHRDPKLYSETDGRLYCVWRSSEDNQQNDIYIAYSNDNGQSWSVPARVNDDAERAPHDHRSIGWLGYDSEENGIVGWLDSRSGKPEVYFAGTLSQPDTLRPERSPVDSSFLPGDRIIPLAPGGYTDTLFYDDFANAPSLLWEVHTGIWVHRDQQYIGYGTSEAKNFVGSEFWVDYVVQGRFSLDRINHQSAIIYVRVNQDERGVLRYYRIQNHFRRGVWVEYFDGNVLRSLTDKPYPVQKDRWYTFKAVVKENVLNYYIDDTLFLVSDDFTHLTQGRVGIGTEYSPTYFKDILISAIE